jgi:thiosulfate reductase cytochrome b subunit
MLLSTTWNLSAILEARQWIFVSIVLGLQNIYHSCEQYKRTFLPVKCQIIFPILDKFLFSRRRSIKDSNINFHENISRWRRFDKPYKQIDEQTRRNYEVLCATYANTPRPFSFVAITLACHTPSAYLLSLKLLFFLVVIMTTRHYAVIMKLSSLFSF